MSAVAERYAQAIFELGFEQNELAPLRDQVTKFGAVVSASDELRGALTNPLIPAQEREGIVQGIATALGISALGTRCLRLIARRSRMGDLSAIAERLAQLVDEKEGVLRGTVVTATDMPESYFEALTREIESATSRRVILERSVDSALIGGAIARLGDTVLDASVRGQLESFEGQIIRALASGTA